MENNSDLQQSLADLENLPRLFQASRLKLNEKIEHLKAIEVELSDAEKTLNSENELLKSDALLFNSLSVVVLAREHDISEKNHHIETLLKSIYRII